tara:strand:- start:111 stop:620 length:510 start_codon:yes stop_codon:yes gene_type:complete
MKRNSELRNWLAIYTKPRHEKVVAIELEKKGVEIFLPLLKERRKWSDRKKWVEFPLFKSYLFARNDNKGIHSFQNTPGFVKVLKFGGKTAIVQNSSINAIKLMLKGGYDPKNTDFFIKGDPVVVELGPLKGLVGEIKHVNNHDRLIVRIDAIQHSISVSIDRKFLKRKK